MSNHVNLVRVRWPGNRRNVSDSPQKRPGAPLCPHECPARVTLQYPPRLVQSSRLCCRDPRRSPGRRRRHRRRSGSATHGRHARRREGTKFFWHRILRGRNVRHQWPARRLRPCGLGGRAPGPTGVARPGSDRCTVRGPGSRSVGSAAGRYSIQTSGRGLGALAEPRLLRRPQRASPAPCRTSAVAGSSQSPSPANPRSLRSSRHLVNLLLLAWCILRMSISLETTLLR